MKGANYVIVEESLDRIVIRDVGPWDQYATITNAAEGVVEELHGQGKLTDEKGLLKVLFYIDSSGDVDQLKHNGEGKFLGFGPCPAVHRAFGIVGS